MSAFPWGWLLLSTGASMIFQEKLLTWVSEHYDIKGVGSPAYLASHPVHASILLVAETEQQHPDHPETPAVSCSSSTPSESEEEEDEDGVASADSADESE